MTNENETYKDIKIEVTIDARSGQISKAIETRAVFFSSDVNTGLVKINLKKDGQALPLANGVEVLVSLVNIADETKGKLTYTPEIEEAEEGVVYWRIPEAIRGKKASYRAGVYVRYTNGQMIHGGYFKFTTDISDIDTNMPEFEEFYWQGWDDFQKEATSEWSEWKANQDADRSAWDNAQKEKQDAFETETNKQMSTLTKQLNELDAEVDEITSLVAENDIVTSIDLAEFASGADTDVLMRHEGVNEVFARDLGTTNYFVQSQLSKLYVTGVPGQKIVDVYGSLRASTIFPVISGKSYQITKLSEHGNIINVSLLKNYPVGGENEVSGTLLPLENGSDLKEYRFDVPEGWSYAIVSLTQISDYPITPDAKIMITEGSTPHTEFYPSPEDLGIVHGQPNLLSNVPATLKTNVTTNWIGDYIPVGESVGVGDILSARYTGFNNSSSRATLILRCYSDQNVIIGAIGTNRYAEPNSEFDVTFYAAQVPEGTSTVRACAIKNDKDGQLENLKCKVIKGPLEIMDDWTPSQSDSGLIPINDGYYQTNTANTVIYGSQGSQRIHADLRAQAESKLNHTFPDFLERASDLKLLAKVQCADGFQVVQGDTVLFESDAAEETSISVDLPVAEVIKDVFIRSKRASDGVNPVIVTVRAQLIYTLKLSMDMFYVTKAEFNDLAARVAALENK
nr:MAG TPA: tail protein [Caudoviricetes sp.]